MTTVASTSPRAQRDWQGYSEYRATGTTWIPNVPSHWGDARLKRVAQFIGGGTPSKDEPAFWGGTIPWVSPKDMKVEHVSATEDNITEEAVRSSSTRLVQAGAVLVVVRSGILRHSIPVAINSVPVALNQDMKAISLNNSILPEYLAALIRGHQDLLLMEWRKSGATVESIEQELLAETQIPIPPLDEQRAIAGFLDRETAQIDALIAKKERLIELLQEKRAALISHAVTKGLDPTAPTRDSGIPWIGHIPAHWEFERNKRLFRESDVRSEAGDEELLSVSHLTGVTRRSEKDVNMFLAESMVGYKVCEPGDLVINTMWAWMGALGIARETGIVSPSYNVYQRRDPTTLDPDYLDLLYRTPQHVAEITRFSEGVWSSRLRLYPKDFFDMYTPIPPVCEQKQIVDYIADELVENDALQTKLRQSIDLATEHRTALISAAVTGKIDVRGEVED